MTYFVAGSYAIVVSSGASVFGGMAGGTSISTADTTATKRPIWLKLVRSGSTISAFKSSDGATWTLIGSDNIGISGSVFVGLAVCSHQLGIAKTATFDSVAVG